MPPGFSSPQEAKSLAKQQRHLQMEAEAARLEHREEHVSRPASHCAVPGAAMLRLYWLLG
jgi:hypothetical protein